MSPAFMTATPAAADSPAQSGMNCTSRPNTWVSARVTKESESSRRLFPMRPAKMSENENLGAAIGQLKQGRRRRPEPGVVADAMIVHRNVQIFTNQHDFTLNVAHIIKCFERLIHASSHMVLKSFGPDRPGRKAFYLKAGQQQCRSYRSFGWKNPIHCHTSSARAPVCRRSQPSQDCRWLNWPDYD